jgi:hypothetical protein
LPHFPLQQPFRPLDLTLPPKPQDSDTDATDTPAAASAVLVSTTTTGQVVMTSTMPIVLAKVNKEITSEQCTIWETRVSVENILGT